ncbi:non-homologous end-joining DNA ligase [Fulvivirga sedimenti]|uniref:DNA ligase (ATP) n=1 Tax=Fulvivirga sedimenti TaxID=2879465 RepID=A0A9X1HYQ5_9BACT|nr:non-homologous end-joining DNA ligase [Fulvivirga sedimenti]MCA6078884.1 non-homologous end-joining DNA ligase [Fulvivirga sedimenti]
MADKQTYVQAGKHSLPISNLEKILFPGSGITKAEVIEYYFQVAPYFLQHSKGRPLSVIRFPDGIEGERFFQKDIPKWAPEWIHTVKFGKESKKNYVVADDAATLVWLANLASLEIHQMHFRDPKLGIPDYIAYDLDPAPDTDFEEIRHLAAELADMLREYGYHPFLKTSGSRGLHIFTPVHPVYTTDQCFEAAKAIATAFIKSNQTATLNLRRESRKGRTLVDIYRNRNGQTIVAPYSLRALEGAPVSMPLHWEGLDTLSSSQEFDISSAIDHLKKEGDAWEGIFSYAVPLHTDKTATAASVQLPINRKNKTASQLKEYGRKRNFSETPEPLPDLKPGNDLSFVIHRHNASRLHYDLRLEEGGVLKSWALPKGLPERPGIKRLAIATEDHPIEYLNFQGDIPKEEYGGGRMWIFSRGMYEIFKRKKNGFYFRLHAPHHNAEYRMHLMKENQWLLERVDEPSGDWVLNPPSPMLAEQRKTVPVNGDYIYELKWDGIRALFCWDENGMKIYSRSGREITENFPELNIHQFHGYNGVFDAEIVCLDQEGKPDFRKVISRMHSRRRQKNAYAYVFDLIYLDGRQIHKEPLWKRRAWLKETLLKSDPHFRYSEDEEDGKAFFKAVKEQQLEGIIAKVRHSEYSPGKRSANWLKIKVRDTSEVFVIGYTKVDDKAIFGALHIAEWVDGSYIYRGKVGTGFTHKIMKEVRSQLHEVNEPEADNIENLPKSRPDDVWVKPEIMVEIRYASITGKGIFREPVYVGKNK